MNIETLNKRIESCNLNIERLENKLVRILKAEESNYEKDNPYYYNEYDKRSTLRELEEVKQKLEKYTNDYQKEKEKANSRNIKVIIDFLGNWKDRVYSYYRTNIEDAKKMWDEVHSMYPNWSDEDYQEKMDAYKKLQDEYHSHLYGHFKTEEYIDHITARPSKARIKVADGKWEFIRDYFTAHDINEGLLKLSKHLSEEIKRKYDFIIERTNKIVGQITDASNLSIGEKGDLNGYILGTRGKAKVETIGAGGYNIQIFHFRTLIKEVK